jgi:hypothetical protein
MLFNLEQNFNKIANDLVSSDFSSFFENDIFFVFKRHETSYEFATFSAEVIPKDEEYNYLFSDIIPSSCFFNLVKFSSTNSIEEAFSFLNYLINEIKDGNYNENNQMSDIM